jgi:CRP-like cAMP-binding protein
VTTQTHDLPTHQHPTPLVLPGSPALPEALFANNALLAGVGPAVLRHILPLVQTLTLGPDAIVFAEDDPGESLYLIAQGSVRISKRGRGGQQETLTCLLENDYFGEMALIDKERRSAQASTVGNTILGRMDQPTWDLLLQFAPNQVMGNFTRSVMQRLRQNNQHFIEQMMRAEQLSLLGSGTGVFGGEDASTHPSTSSPADR